MNAVLVVLGVAALAWSVDGPATALGFLAVVLIGSAVVRVRR